MPDRRPGKGCMQPTALSQGLRLLKGPNDPSCQAPSLPRWAAELHRFEPAVPNSHVTKRNLCKSPERRALTESQNELCVCELGLSCSYCFHLCMKYLFQHFSNKNSKWSWSIVWRKDSTFSSSSSLVATKMMVFRALNDVLGSDKMQWSCPGDVAELHSVLRFFNVLLLWGIDSWNSF